MCSDVFGRVGVPLHSRVFYQLADRVGGASRGGRGAWLRDEAPACAKERLWKLLTG